MGASSCDGRALLSGRVARSPSLLLPPLIVGATTCLPGTVSIIVVSLSLGSMSGWHRHCLVCSSLLCAGDVELNPGPVVLVWGGHAVLTSVFYMDGLVYRVSGVFDHCSTLSQFKQVPLVL